MRSDVEGTVQTADIDRQKQEIRVGGGDGDGAARPLRPFAAGKDPRRF